MVDPDKARLARLANAAIPWMEAKFPALKQRALHEMAQTTEHIALLDVRATVKALDRLMEEARRDVVGGSETV